MGVKNWLLSVALTKVIKRVVIVIVAWIAGHNVDQFGVAIDPAQLSLAIYAGVEFVRNWLKVKFNLGWL